MACFLNVNESETVGKINIDDLYEKKKNRDLKQLAVFNKILNRIHVRIKAIGKNKKNDRHIWFTVPEHIFGEPMYNKGDCIAYLVHKLEENGFLVKYIHPNTIFVSWNNWVPQYVRTEFKKKTGKLMNEKGEISDIQKIETEESMITTQQRNILTKNKKEYTSTGQYKPTGRFVYNPAILQKLEEKLN